MPSDRRGGRLTPEQISRATFATSFRGFDQDQVRLLLAQVAEALRDAGDHEAALEMEIESLRARTSGAPLDEASLTAALGEETARVLTAAREAAVEMRAKGEESVARMLREAQDDAASMRADADAVLRERTRAAEAEAAAIRSAAEERAAAAAADAAAAASATREAAAQVMADARAAAERTRAEAATAAEAEVERAREQGRAMVGEAQLVRERVLKDLARKRKTARAQLEQLRAGRERLLEAYDLVRSTVEEATGELKVSLTEAKLAADAAVRRVEEETEPTVGDLEAEVEAARAAGLPLVELPPPAVPEPGAHIESGLAQITGGGLHEGDARAAAAPGATPNDGAPKGVGAGTGDGALPPLPEDIPPAPPALDPIRPPRKGRRKRGVPDLPPAELQPMSPPDPVEGMRVITGEVPAVSVAAPLASEAVGSATVPADRAAEVAAAVVEADVAVGESDAAAASGEPGDDSGALASAREVTGESAVDVDDIFARIRAARSDKVARANELLAVGAGDAGDDGPAGAEPDADAGGAEPAETAAIGDIDAAPAAEAGPDELGAVVAQTDDEAVLERRDAITDELEQKVTRKLKRLLADEQNGALDGLRRSRSPGLDALYPDGLEEQLARWAAAAAPELDDAARAGGAFHGAAAQPRPTDDLASTLASDLVTPLRDRVERSLRDAGGDEEAAADGLRAAYREWKSRRIADLARDAVAAAFARGLFDGTGDLARMRWLVDDGGVPCPDCDDDALAGPVTKGEAFPTGHCHPPAHPGCRCLLVPAR